MARVVPEVRSEKYTRTAFDDWIEEVGSKWIADQLGIQFTTVDHWRAKRSYPRIPAMMQIKKLSGGRVDYGDIIERAKPANAHVRGGYRGYKG